MNVWPQLWAREVPMSEVRVGHVLTFVKAPLESGEYGLVDTLISALDSTPLTHAGLVVDRADDAPVIAHSTFDGVLVGSLDALAFHDGAPMFVFAHTSATAETLDAAAAVARNAGRPNGRDPAGSYPLADLLLEAVLLRVRLMNGFDEHRHRYLAEVLDAVLPERGRRRMCAAFIAQTFADIGLPIEPPAEAAAFDAGLLDVEVTELPESARRGLVEGIGSVAGDVRSSLTRGRPDPAGGPRFAEVREIAEHLAAGFDEAEAMVGWLSAPVLSDPPAGIARVVAAIDDLSPSPRDDGLRARFTTVHDLVRSPSFRPVGHVRNWCRQHPG